MSTPNGPTGTGIVEDSDGNGGDAEVRRRPSLRHRARTLLVAVAAVFVVACGLATAGLVSAHEGRTHLLDQLDPAIQHTDAYLTALVDEETGVRGYAASHQTDFLQPYRSGKAETALAASQLRPELATFGHDRTRFAQIEALVAAWQQQWVHPFMHGATAPPASTRTGLAVSTASFNRIRQAVANLDKHLISRRQAAVRGFDEAYWLLVGVVVTVLALVAAIVVAAGMTLRRSVIRPLLEVAADSRQVAGGDLERRVRPAGPAEIAALATDIEAMRERLVADLHAIEEAGAELEERGQELARSNRDLEQFAYVASHDLQEPLRKVASFCQLLAERYRDEIDERGVQYIDFAVDGAKRMQSLVNDLLAFSRVGRTTEAWEEIDLRAVLDQAASNLDRRVAESGGRIEVGAELPRVRGDRSLLVALWQNLIGNSLKFRGDEPPVIRIATEHQGDAWTFTVADNGIGIEAAYAERVFVIFQRLHTRDRYEGTGIGLALCRKIVEFHGGEIAVEPRPAGSGPGTTIRFTLPAPHAANRSEEPSVVPA